ncbi:MAG: hypothetical protein GY788_21005 [bacterium]|nr:hypothetical protein [bacterium]
MRPSTLLRAESVFRAAETEVRVLLQELRATCRAPAPVDYETTRCLRQVGHEGECIAKSKRLEREVRWMDSYAPRFGVPPSGGE